MPYDNSSSPPTLEIRWARVSQIREAVETHHAVAHWRESGSNQNDVPLDPDWPQYLRLEKAGAYKVMAAWRKGRLAAYAGYLVAPSMQFRSTQHALNLAIYTAPWARGIGGLIVRRAEHALAQLVKPKIIRIVYEAPVIGTFDAVLDRLGYELFATVRQKVVKAA